MYRTAVAVLSPRRLSMRRRGLGAAFFTAFREQLGLRFQSATGPLDAYVIDRVVPPTPD
jgi:uncharacterized protein (TIGR03435 family)